MRCMYNSYSCTWTMFLYNTFYGYTFKLLLLRLHDLSITFDRCGESYIKKLTTTTITNSKSCISISNKPPLAKQYIRNHLSSKNDFWIYLKVINPLINTIKIENSFLVLNVIQLSTWSIVCWWLFCFTQFW